MKDFLFIGGPYHKQLKPVSESAKRSMVQENGTRTEYRKCLVRCPDGNFEFFLERNIDLEAVIETLQRRRDGINMV